MPDYSDPMDAAVRRPTVGGLGGAYNRTDVLHDPNYLIATAQNPNRHIAQAAILRLHDLYRQDALAQRNQALDLRLPRRSVTAERHSFPSQSISTTGA